MQALKDINYQGVFNMEADMFLYNYGERLLPESSHMLCRIGQDLVNEVMAK